MFVELLGRSCFSFLRGASQPEELITEAQDLGLGGIALCDLHGLYGAVRAWQCAKGHPLQLIVGAELTLANQSRSVAAFETESPLLAGAPLPEPGTSLTVALLVQSARGYETLCRLLTKSHKNQEKGKCLCEASWFAGLNRDLFALIVAPSDPRKLRWSREDNLFEQLKEAFSGRLAVATYRHLDARDALRQRWVEKISGTSRGSHCCDCPSQCPQCRKKTPGRRPLLYPKWHHS